MRHVASIASRDLRALFVSPVAYGVLSLFAILAGVFFILNVAFFNEQIFRMQQFQAFDYLQQWNLNDHLIAEFYGSMSVVLLFLIPGVTMGLFTAEKANGTQEMLLTSPLLIYGMALNGNISTFSHPVPPTASLVGVSVLVQGAAEQAGVNAAGLLATAGLELTAGMK